VDVVDVTLKVDHAVVERGEFSVLRSGSSTPPVLETRTVATITAALGLSPQARMSTNF
jgi:hypothetical protein